MACHVFSLHVSGCNDERWKKIMEITSHFEAAEKRQEEKRKKTIIESQTQHLAQVAFRGNFLCKHQSFGLNKMEFGNLIIEKREKVATKNCVGNANDCQLSHPITHQSRFIKSFSILCSMNTKRASHSLTAAAALNCVIIAQFTAAARKRSNNYVHSDSAVKSL
jgi:hypothetical protein